MRYALMVYSDQSTWLGPLRRRGEHRHAQSRCPSGCALRRADEGRSSRRRQGARRGDDREDGRVRDGNVLVTDGPFAETKEQIGGVFEVSLPDLDMALALAAKIPTAAHGTIEVRPIVERETEAGA